MKDSARRYRLSAELRAHKSDVRDVVELPRSATAAASFSAAAAADAATASRDTNVFLWSLYRSRGAEVEEPDAANGSRLTQPELVASFSRAHEHYVNALAVLGDGPTTYLATGSSDKTVRVWRLSDGACVLSLAEHSAAVCALRTAPQLSAFALLSSSWDHTARLWRLDDSLAAAGENGAGGGELMMTASSWRTLRGHDAAVWDALMLSDTRVITASADKSIRVWDSHNGSCVGKLSAPQGGIVRALAPAVHLPAAPAGFVSVSNEGDLTVWSGGGGGGSAGGEFSAVQRLEAVHSGEFVYCVDSTTSTQGAYVTGGEDCTARILAASGDDDGNVAGAAALTTVATMAHPSTVWSACWLRNGDVLTGCADGVARVFSAERARWAPEHALAEYDELLASKKVSSKVVGGVDVAKLPLASDALRTPGRQEGEKKLVRRDDGEGAEVHMWNAAEMRWQKVGDLVSDPNDSAPSSSSGAAGGGPDGVIDGRYYDFVFEVEVGEGGAKEKLGYHRGENSYVAAQRFIDRHELNQDFLEQIAQFIDQNVGVSDRTPSAEDAAAAGAVPYSGPSDPLTGSGRYVPRGMAPSQPTPPPPASGGAPAPSTSYIPQRSYSLYKTTTQAAKIAEKLRENAATARREQASAALDDRQIAELVDVVTPKVCADELVSWDELELIVKALHLPAPLVFPALDLARLTITKADSAEQLTRRRESEGEGGGVLPRVLELVSNGSASMPLLVLACRFLCNLFATPHGVQVAEEFMPDILSATQSGCESHVNKRVRETYATLLLNFAVRGALSEHGGVRANADAPMSAILRLLKSDDAQEVLLRAMVAVGTIMSASASLTALAEANGVAEATARAAPKSSELLSCAGDVAKLLVGNSSGEG